MSNKGAIKKTPATKDVSKSSVRSKTKSTSNTEDSNVPGKREHRVQRGQTSEQKDDGDRKRMTQNSSASRTQLSSNSRASIKSSQIKPARDTSSSSALKSTSSTSRTHVKTVSNPRTKSDTTTKLTSSNVTRTSQSVQKSKGTYSEKRGTSTIYMPQSVSSKLKAKPVDKSPSLKDKVRYDDKSKNSRVQNKGSAVPRERKLSRTLSPSEVKMLHSAGVSRTPVNNAVGAFGNADHSQENEYDYEDDFEDYESDFQECTDSDASEISEESTSSRNNVEEAPIELHSAEQKRTVNSAEHQKIEEEHMYDSGHYELAEARRRAARIESIASQSKSSSLLELRTPINKAHSEDKSLENKSLPSSTDEGFEDSRSGDFTKSLPLSQVSFIDFRKNKENPLAKKPAIKTRGEELLEMIKLDAMGWSMLELTPIPYDEFIRCYGKLNSQQIATQTGEDNIDTEVQTDTISFKNKWTQFPVTVRNNLQHKEDLDLFKLELVGVGGDDDEKTLIKPSLPSFDVLRLTEFVSRAGRVILSLLEERKCGGNVFKKNEEDLPFSDGFVKLFINSVTFLAGRPVTIIHYSEVLNKVLLTIHSPAEEEIETISKQDYITDCCIGCVWNISEPSMPIKLFYSTCPISACCFHLTNYNIVFCGLQDGSISLWDLNEDEWWHQKVTDKANELDWIIRTPTYTTAANADLESHKSSIVGIRILSKIEDKSFDRRNNRFIPIQICSLDQEGVLIIWSVLSNIGISVNDLGQSYWGDIRLTKSQELHLNSNNHLKKTNAVTFIDIRVDCIDTNNLYIATDTTSILHATCIGNKPNPVKYEIHESYPCGNVTCIETCPFERSFFLVGCDDGTIRLHSLNVEKPILQLKDEHQIIGIKAMQWSKSKPCMIYVLDNNSRIHVWDLNNSDIDPSFTINLRNWGNISSMQLSPCRTEQDMKQQYLALGTESGSVEIHKLSGNFSYSKKNEYQEELNTFMRYIAIL